MLSHYNISVVNTVMHFFCCVTMELQLLVVGWCYDLRLYSKIDLGTDAPVAKIMESVITVMACEAGLYMVNMNARTFLWLKLLIVELWVLARYIFSICVMFSLPLWMGSVYCELPLEDLLWDQISLTQWFSVGLSAPHIHMFHPPAGLGVFFLGAPSVTVVNKDRDGERSIQNLSELLLTNHSITFKQGESQNTTY